MPRVYNLQVLNFSSSSFLVPKQGLGNEKKKPGLGNEKKAQFIPMMSI